MKRAFALMLVLLLILTGCGGKNRSKDVSVKDGCCPFEITHKKGVVELTLQDGENRGIQWNVEVTPEDACEVTEVKTDKESTVLYRITGKRSGATLMTFTASQADETNVFMLDLIVEVDEEGNAEVPVCVHRELAPKVVEENGLKYQWNVDEQGILNFAFINDEDIWKVRMVNEDVCMLKNKMITPSGCTFSLQAIAVGTTTVELVGNETQRTICVTIQLDENDNFAVTSVREQ